MGDFGFSQWVNLKLYNFITYFIQKRWYKLASAQPWLDFYGFFLAIQQQSGSHVQLNEYIHQEMGTNNQTWDIENVCRRMFQFAKPSWKNCDPHLEIFRLTSLSCSYSGVINSGRCEYFFIINVVLMWQRCFVSMFEHWRVPVRKCGAPN